MKKFFNNQQPGTLISSVLVIFRQPILLFYIYLCSCNSRIDFDNYILKEPKLVIFGYLTEDSIISVNLSKSCPLYDTSYIFIDNAYIELFENENYAGILNKLNNGNYDSDIKPKIGNKYGIIVNYNKSQLSAECVIPSKVMIDTAYLLPTKIYDIQGYKLSQFIFTMTDNENEKNFYMLKVKFSIFPNNIIESLYYPDTTYVNAGISSFDYSIIEEMNDNKLSASLFFTDSTFKEKKKEFLINYFLITDQFTNNSNKYMLHIYLYSLSKDLYFFKKKLFKYYLTKNYSADDLGNPIEPVILNTNITNGYGIFGAYTVDSITLKNNF